MTNAGIAKRIEKYQPKSDMKSTDLKTFNPDEFKTHEDALWNLLSQTTSVTRNCSLLYIVRLAVAPFIFTDDFEDCMFQMPLIGKEYNLDSRTFYVELKALLFGGKEYSWIEHYDHGANGRAAFQKRVEHYNGA